MLGIVEDYFGYFDPVLKSILDEILGYMLIEASPRKYSSDNLNYSEFDPYIANPVQLLSAAWTRYDADPNKYDQWEVQTITDYLSTY